MKIKVLILCLVLVYAAGAIGSVFTSKSAESNWYLQNKPDFTPPGWVFGAVWTILYFLIALSLYFSWIKAGRKEKKKVAWVFGINLILNALWSVLFFGFKKPEAAFIDLIFIWITILIMIFISGRIDRKAGWLLVPYLLWVSFAGFLNWGFFGLR